jgi:hypothetical protein
VSGSGGIGGTSDRFHFVFQPASGNAQIVARIAELPDTGAGSKSGIMIRETLATGSAHVALLVTGGNRYQFQRRVTAGAATSYTSGSQTAPVWVKLVRAGNTFTAHRSSNGTSWTPLGTRTIAMGASVSVGLVVASGDITVAGLATFDNVAVTP